MSFQFLQAIIFKYQTDIFELKMTPKHWFGLSATASLYNLVFPARGGLIARGYFLQKKYGLRYANYAGLMLLTLLVGFLTTSLAALGANVLNYMEQGQFNQSTLSVAILGSLSSLFILTAMMVLPKRKIGEIAEGWPKLNSLWKGFTQSTDQFKSNWKRIIPLAVTFLVVVLMMSVRLMYSGQLIDHPLSFVSCLVIQTMVGLSVFISFTPGNLGVKEGIIVAILSSQQVSPEIAIMIAAVDRLSSALVILLMGIPFHFSLIRDKNL